MPINISWITLSSTTNNTIGILQKWSYLKIVHHPNRYILKLSNFTKTTWKIHFMLIQF